MSPFALHLPKRRRRHRPELLFCLRKPRGLSITAEPSRADSQRNVSRNVMPVNYFPRDKTRKFRHERTRTVARHDDTVCPPSTTLSSATTRLISPFALSCFAIVNMQREVLFCTGVIPAIHWRALINRKRSFLPPSTQSQTRTRKHK